MINQTTFRAAVRRRRGRDDQETICEWQTDVPAPESL
jgi:hypothetical protein